MIVCKNIFFISFMFLFLHTTKGVSQNAPNPTDNKNIGMCNMYGDTLKLEDLKCGTVTMHSDKKIIVTSFMFSYYLSGKMNVKLINGFGNILSKADLEELLKIKPKKIFIQDVIGESGTEIVNIGHRTIYIR
jgi:hypothetical protein